MKIIYTCALLCLGQLVCAQTFSDNFDGYTAGNPLAQQSNGEWTTWSNAPGGTEDGLVSDVRAKSLPNAMYFSSDVQGGGPVDQVRNFGLLNTGQFSLNMNLFVEAGKSAYFNFQGNETIGNEWALDVNFNDDGSLLIDNSVSTLLEGSYGQNSWFNFRIDINFNTNHWEIFLNDITIGSFSNERNHIASINIYPTDQTTPYQAGFYVDDFQYTITPYDLPNLNAAVNALFTTGPNIAGAEVAPKVRVRNLGKNKITSFDVTVTYNGTDVTQNFSSLNLVSLAQADYTFTNLVKLVPGKKNMRVTISNVNGLGADDDSNDDILTIKVDPIVPAFGKAVLGEEGTGTWCQWCPRGAVFMDYMEKTYGEHWAGVAVHNSDPMTNATYDSGLGSLVNGYPSALVDRGSDVDPSEMEGDFFKQIIIAPQALLRNEAVWDEVNRTLTVIVKSEFLMAADNTYKLACVLTEDSVTGTDAGYAQSNAYAGGGNGVMGGFESLPSKVPANLMVYHHVGREISPSFGGKTDAFPASVNSGDIIENTFTFTLPTEWREKKMHIISMLINPNGSINNVGKATFDEAIAAPLTEVVVACGGTVTRKESTDGNLAPDVLGATTFSTDCPGGIVHVSQTPPVGAALKAGMNEIKVMATDDCGNLQVCATLVNLEDDTQASIDCGNAISMTNSVDGNQVPNFISTVSSTSNCTIGTVEISQSPAAGTILKNGVNDIILTIVDGCGNTSTCSKTVDFTDDLSTITELEQNNLFQLYPNPVSNELNFKSTTKAVITHIAIYAANGQLLYNKSVDKSEGIVDVSQFPTGIYTLKFNTKSGLLATLKFTKQ